LIKLELNDRLEKILFYIHFFIEIFHGKWLTLWREIKSNDGDFLFIESLKKTE